MKLKNKHLIDDIKEKVWKGFCVRNWRSILSVRSAIVIEVNKNIYSLVKSEIHEASK